VIEKIAVLGAGTMGHGIATIFAMHGYDVSLYEVELTKLQAVKEEIARVLEIFAEEGIIREGDINAVLERIKLFSALEPAVWDRDFVIEAVPEELALKQMLFKRLDEYCLEHTIFASNTSSLRLNDMMKDISEGRRKKIMVNHFYNPPHIMPIVELSYFGNMPEETYREIESLYISVGKQPVKVLKDIPGLVANRIQQGVAREVFSLIELGAAAPEDIDKALKFGPAFRYATSGQLEIADMGGLDIWCSVGDSLLAEIDNSQKANPLLRQKVGEGKLGLKSGEGFFKYSAQDAEEAKSKFIRRLINQLKASKNYV
jgi:3-hydroxybutyryl-CoA dehydrogenase